MAKKKRARFNPKKEVSVMAWIEDDKGSVLLVRQVVGQRLWTLPGGKEVQEETGLDLTTIGYQQMYDRPKRGAVTILFKVSVKRHAARMHFPVAEIADIGFFDRLPSNATPSAKFFWKSESSH